MAITNKVMLITYPDSLGKNLTELNEVLENDLKGAVGGKCSLWEEHHER